MLRELEVVADVHERGSGVPEALVNDYGVKVVFRKLSAGDYAIGHEIGIERKTAIDFCKSLVSGRFFAQVSQLRAEYLRSVVIIEGPTLQVTKGLHPRAIKGALASLAAGWQVPFIRTSGPHETAEFLFLATRQERELSHGYSKRHGYKPKRKRRQQLFILQGIPGIGPVRAEHLLDHFGSVQRVFSARRDELLEVPYIGPAQADRIIDIGQR